ncbi:hypothetical protein [Streptococcus pluranimalium]|uniref:hypothetical protein n=1 Tax=Streptococcus pluranimalium TaxID=82348 RepID=UPI003F693987
MKLLHTKSIRDCTEKEKDLHQAEVKRLLEMIESLSNYDCESDVTYLDDYHHNQRSSYFLETNLHRIGELLQNEDIKNGVDIYLTDEKGVAFRAYGQGHSWNDKSDFITTLITVKCFGEGWSPIDMSKVFTPPKQSLQKDLSM